MSIYRLTREQSRQVDRLAMERYEVPGLLLMENAGIGVVEILKSFAIDVGKPITICCGKGNNGGDGFVIARHLLICGYDVRLWIFADPTTLHGDAAVQYKIVHNLFGNVKRFSSESPSNIIGDFRTDIHNSSWIVDALLGTGASGTPGGAIGRGIELINEQKRISGAKILAIDVPSGLDCETGFPNEPAIRADHTCTFVAAKTGFAAKEAAEFLGTVHVVNIGIPSQKFIDEVLR